MKCTSYLFIFLFLSFCSTADDYYWNDPAGGELGDSMKWNPSLTPGPDDYVHFELPNTYTVRLEDYYTHDKLLVEGSDLTLDLNGYDYYLDTPDDYYQTVIIGDYVPSSLTLSGGSVICGDLFTGRNDSAAVGTLNVSGSFLSGSINGWHGFFFGTSGDSVVRVTDGAYMEHGHGQSGIYRSCEFLVDGEYTEWYVDGSFEMSVYGTTKLALSNGARARIGHLQMATGVNSSAVINVTGVSQNTELAVENWWDPIGLYLGKNGSGAINLRGSKLYVASSMAIASEEGGSGELNVYDGSWADVVGSVGVGGTPDAAGGRGVLNLYDEDPGNGEYVYFYCTQEMGESMAVWPEGAVHLNAATIKMEDDMLPEANPIILRGGLLDGWGWIYAEVINESGIVRPGVTTLWKELNLNYNYEQGPAGTLKIGIGGTSSAWNYGVLKVNDPSNGQAALDGMLDVDLLYGFVPNYTDEFTIIEAQSVSGQFINAPATVVFEGGTFEVIYDTDGVVLTHFEAEPKCPAYPAADLSRDCLVNLNDLAIAAGQWLQCGFEPGSYCP